MRSLAAACLFALLAWSPVARAQEALSPDEVRPLEVAGRFDEAAALLEQRAASPGVAPALARAWIDRALDYRLALGDVTLASRTLEALAAVAPAAHVATRALELGDALTRGRRWQESTDFHTAWLARHGRRADATLRARANVTLGNAWRELGDEARALAAYRAVQAMASSPAFSPHGRARAPSPACDPIAARESSEAADLCALPMLRAEAMFWQVEPRHRRFVARGLPTYGGAPTRRGHDLWVESVWTPAVHATVSELQGPLSRAYSAITLERAPTWEIAAYERMASAFFWLYGDLVFRSRPPPDVVRNPARYAANPMAEPPGEIFLLTALEGFRRCVGSSTWYRETRLLPRCELALYDIDRCRFPLRDEVTPAPDQGVFAARDLPAVLHASDLTRPHAASR